MVVNELLKPSQNTESTNPDIMFSLKIDVFPNNLIFYHF